MSYETVVVLFYTIQTFLSSMIRGYMVQYE